MSGPPLHTSRTRGVVRRRFLVLSLSLVALVTAAVRWAHDGEESPAQAQTISAPASAASPPAVPPSVAGPAPALAVSAVPVAAPPRPRISMPDPSRFQRDVQQALSSDQPGLAFRAAKRIATCVGLEGMRSQMQAVMEERQRTRPSDGYRDAVAATDQFFAGCQSLDAASRAQLIPLLRRALHEGERGAAAALVRQIKDFDPAGEAEAMAAIKRDAWACDRSSISTLGLLAVRHAQLLTANELGAIRQMQRNSPFWGRMAGRPGASQVLERLKPPADADPAEVARLAAGIEANCSQLGENPPAERRGD